MIFRARRTRERLMAGRRAQFSDAPRPAHVDGIKKFNKHGGGGGGGGGGGEVGVVPAIMHDRNAQSRRNNNLTDDVI